MNKVKIRHDIAEVLEHYGYEWTHTGVNVIVDTFVKRKKQLAELLSNHPNWDPEKLMTTIATETVRRVEPKVVQETVKNFLGESFLEKARDCETEEAAKKRKEECCVYVPNSVWNFLLKMASYPFQNANEQLIIWIEDNFSWVEHPFKFQVDMKVSRLFNKIMTYFGYGKVEYYDEEKGKVRSLYEKYYAKYSDAINPLTIQRLSVLSINPVDYLLMSNGNSWHSCYSIDQKYSGEYKGGTISYMLDSASMIYYEVDRKVGEDIELKPKITRQVYAYNDGILLQSRLYPQNWDDQGDIYKRHRAIVQKCLAECEGVESLWGVEFGTNICSDVVNDNGICYPDWKYHESCNTSYLTELREAPEEIEIGATALCIMCGDPIDQENKLFCDRCKERCDEE